MYSLNRMEISDKRPMGDFNDKEIFGYAKDILTG